MCVCVCAVASRAYLSGSVQSVHTMMVAKLPEFVSCASCILGPEGLYRNTTKKYVYSVACHASSFGQEPGMLQRRASRLTRQGLSSPPLNNVVKTKYGRTYAQA